MEKEHINSLTTLRFFAAYLVVGYHFFPVPKDYTLITRVFSRGYLGVDFFFLLSGFILAYTYGDQEYWNKKNTLNFFKNRFARIAPMYYFSLVLALPLFYYFSTTSDLDSTYERLLAFITQMTFLHGWIPIKTTLSTWNPPSWSLSVEMFFYILFPIFVFKILKPFKHIQIRLMLIFFILSIGSFFIFNNLPLMIKGERIYWSNLPLYHIFNFGIGSCLWPIYKKISVKKSFYIETIILSLGVVFVLIVFLSPVNKFWIKSGSPLTIASFSILILGLSLNTWMNKISSLRPLLILGESSYGLYIMQAPLKLFSQQLWSKIFKLGPPEGFIYIMYLTIVLVTFSIVGYYLIERPVRIKIKTITFS